MRVIATSAPSAALPVDPIDRLEHDSIALIYLDNTEFGVGTPDLTSAEPRTTPIRSDCKISTLPIFWKNVALFAISGTGANKVVESALTPAK